MRVPNVHCPYSDVADNKRITAATRRISHLGTLLGSRWIVAGHREQGTGHRWRSRKRTTVGHRHHSCGSKTTTCAPALSPVPYTEQSRHAAYPAFTASSTLVNMIRVSSSRRRAEPQLRRWKRRATGLARKGSCRRGGGGGGGGISISASSSSATWAIASPAASSFSVSSAVLRRSISFCSARGRMRSEEHT